MGFQSVADLFVEGKRIDDDAYDFVMSVADGTLSELGQIASRLRRWSRAR